MGNKAIDEVLKEFKEARDAVRAIEAWGEPRI